MQVYKSCHHSNFSDFPSGGRRSLLRHWAVNEYKVALILQVSRILDVLHSHNESKDIHDINLIFC